MLGGWQKQFMHSRFTRFKINFRSKREKNSLIRICIFLARVYIRAWFLSTEAIKAPYHDFQFMRELISYRDIDPEISKATAKKFSNHFWYLAPETVGLSIFDDNVPTQVRANMTQVMLEADKGQEEEEEKIEVKKYILHQKDFSFLYKLGVFVICC